MEYNKEDWRRPFEVDYFELQDYIDKIQISDYIKNRLDDTNKLFEVYLKKLRETSHFDETKDGYALIYNWLDDSKKELEMSAEIEGHKFTFNNDDLINGELFFEKLNINNDRIKKIHSFVCQNSGTNKILVGEYRKNPARVSVLLPNGEEDIYWYGVKAQDILQFMKSFINYYKERKLDPIYYNPFLKSALVHMLFVRIHPFGDGNGRTARILHNITFTSEINKFYDTKLKLAPVNISSNIKIYQPTYTKKLNMIKFNIDEDTNEEINAWFDFILNMYEEQMYYQTNRLDELELAFKTLELLKDDDDEIVKLSKKSKINKMF